MPCIWQGLCDAYIDKLFVPLIYVNQKRINEKDEVFFIKFTCYKEQIILQKLNYMHLNPTAGKFPLVNNPCDYLHGSARFYICNEEWYYKVMNYCELNDIDLTK